MAKLTRGKLPSFSFDKAIPLAAETRLHFLWPSLVVSLIALATVLGFYLQVPDNLFALQIFYYQFITHEIVGSVVALLILLVALFLAPRVPLRVVEQAVAGLARHPLVVIGVAVVILSLLTGLVYHHHPLALDEYAPVFQARIFAAGKLWTSVPTELVSRLIPPFFVNVFFMVSPQDDGSSRVISAYWPGFALLLTPFAKLRVPWLLNPLLAGATLALLWHVSRKLFPDPLAPGWALLLTLASPAFIVNAISYYSMNAHLLLNLLFAVLLLEPKGHRVFLAGLAGSLALSLHNPVPHTLFALPWIVWLAWRPGRVRKIGLLALGYLPLVLLLGVGWLVLRTQFRADLLAAAGGSAPATGVEGVLARVQGLAREFIGLPDLEILWARYIGYLKVFLWAVPGLPILAFLGWFRQRENTACRLFAWSAVLTVVGFLLIPRTQGHGWGFRHFHYAWATLPLLATAALSSRRWALGADRRSSWIRVVGVTAILSLVVGNAVRLRETEGFIRRQLAQVPQVQGNGRQVVFLDLHDGYYVADLVQNDPFLEDRQWRLLSRGQAQDEAWIRSNFPEARRVYAKDGTSVWQVGE